MRDADPVVTTRKSVAADVPAIIDLVKASWARTYDPVIGVEARKAISDAKHTSALFLGEIERANAASMVAEVDAQIIGHTGGYMRPTTQSDKTFFIDHLHVEPSFFSAGVATKLMNAIANEVAPIADCIELTVLENNSRAIGFYKKHGFEAVSGDNEDSGLGGVASRLMRWNLS